MINTIARTIRRLLLAITLGCLLTGSVGPSVCRVAADEPVSAAPRIESILEQPSQAAFAETPLEEALQVLSNQHKLPILIERHRLADANIAPHTPVTVQFANIPLRTALDMLLRPLRLDWEISDELLKVSTREEIAGRFDTRVHPVRDLLELGLTTRDLSQTIVATVAADSWEYDLGTATIQQLPGALMIRHNRRTHGRIERLLAELRGVLSGRRPSPSPERRRLHSELDNATTLDFFDTPLRDAMRQLAALHEIPILIDEPALAAIGLSPEVLVNQTLAGISLRSALNLILEPLGLQTMVEDGVLLVTTQIVVADSIETRVYDVRPLVQAGLVPADLVKVLGRTVRTGFDRDGRPLDAIHAVSGTIVVEASPPVHEKVGELLAALARQAAAQLPLPVETSAPREKAEAAIREALREETQFDFMNVPFVEAMEFLEDSHDLLIRYDQVSLERAEVEPDTPVSLSLSDVRLQTVLDLLLEPLGLDWVIEDEVLKITTRMRAEATMRVRLYDVSDLAPAKLTTSQLADTLQAGVAPDSWTQMDGPPSIVSIGRVFVVSQSDRNHRQIGKLLDELRRRLD
jgi:hypothetical protein